jgi:DNA-binding transcriptional LysR family regulator
MESPQLLDGRLKLRHLTLVDALGRHGSIVAAARALHTTQPALTRSLHDLEDILGVELYVRGPRGLVPTVFGEAFTRDARAVISQLGVASERLAELVRAEQGTVIVGTHLAGSNLLLPWAVARYKTARPKVTVVIHEASPEALRLDLASGRVDFIVGRLTGDARESEEYEALYEEPIVAVCRQGHPALEAGVNRLEQLVEYPWIVPGRQTSLRRELELMLVRHGLRIPDDHIETTSILVIRQLLADTDILAVLPLLIARDEIGAAILPVSLDPLSRTVGLTLPAMRMQAPAALALVEDLRAVAEKIRATVAA